MKKKITSMTVALCALLFIPLVIAVIFALNVDPNSVTAQNLTTLNVSCGENNFTFDDTATFDLYSSAISDNSREIDATFRPFDEETPCVVTFTEEGSEPITYKLYMTTNSQDCVYVSPDDKYFIMDEAAASKLIVRDEFSSLNTLKTLPVLTVTSFDKDIILSADSYTWTYTALDGTKASANGKGKEVNPAIAFDIGGSGLMKLSFDKEPDALTLRIAKDGDVIFEDKYENLALATSINYANDTKLTLTITAQWYEMEGAEYFGEATYTAPLIYDVAPSYEIVDVNGVPAGDFTVLRIKNFNEGEKLNVSNEIGIPEVVNVYNHDTDNNLKIAFVPLKSDLEAGKYDLVLTTENGHKETVTVKVRSSKERDNLTLIFTDDDLEAAFTAENIEEFQKLVTTYTESSVDKHLYDGKFIFPNGQSKLRLTENGIAYGTQLKVISRYSAEYIHDGVQLEVVDKQNLVAANNGTVVYADKSALYGNLVIIDHGCGILSYCGNMDSISVSVGDSVVGGETVIGKAGSTGFACVPAGAEAKKAPVAYFAVSIDGVFIDPSSPCSYGINV